MIKDEEIDMEATKVYVYPSLAGSRSDAPPFCTLSEPVLLNAICAVKRKDLLEYKRKTQNDKHVFLKIAQQLRKNA